MCKRGEQGEPHGEVSNIPPTRRFTVLQRIEKKLKAAAHPDE